MWGDKTINAYCWILLPYRIEYLNKLGIAPIYTGTDSMSQIFKISPRQYREFCASMRIPQEAKVTWKTTRRPWPNQPKPAERAWTLWKHIIQSLCKSESWHLRSKLGPWTNDHSRHCV